MKTTIMTGKNFVFSSRWPQKWSPTK